MYWIGYFICVAVIAIVNIFRFEYKIQDRNDERDIYDIFIIFYGVTSCGLLLALNHQRKFRSS